MKIEVPYFRQETEYSCGPAVVRMMLAYFNIHETEEKIASMMECSACLGTSNYLFKKVFSAFNLKCQEMTQMTFEMVVSFIQSDMPLLVNYQNIHDKRGHFALVVGVEGDELVLNDPEYGENYHLTRNVFDAHWKSQDGEYVRWGCVATK